MTTIDDHGAPGPGAPRPAPSPRGRWTLVLLLVAAVAIAAALAFGGGPAGGLVAGRIRAMALAHGLDARWTSLRVTFPRAAHLTGLTLTRRTDDVVVFRADSLDARLDLGSLLRLAPRLARVDVEGVTIATATHASADPDTLAPIEPRSRNHGDDPARAAHVRELARSLVRLLTAPARALPRVTLRHLTLNAAGDEEPDAANGGAPPAGAEIDRFTVVPDPTGVRIAATGTLHADQRVPFVAALDYGRDDRLTGIGRFVFAEAATAARETLRVAIAGALHQDRRAGRVTVVDATRLTVGSLTFALSGVLDQEGPSFRLALDADSLTAAQWQESLPHAVLGPLADLSVRGWYAWHLRLDLDVSRPDSVGFTAQVVPHGLAIDPGRTRLSLLTLDAPFIARIHLPHDRIVERDLSPANPHFRPLEAIDSLLIRSVLANEDGGFFRHQGFNLEAVRGAIADNLKAGAFRRGAGTVTMQLVRNLYLGHRRTLSRKGQEVVLTWVLEHLTPLTKERMLEIYLNIIEWGPDVHGADEAAWYYLGHDAGRLTIDEALFLATVVPAPSKWRYRFDTDGALRPFARAQMHFIGQSMVARGWLAPEALPGAEALHVEIRGQARDVLFPPASATREPRVDGRRLPRETRSGMAISTAGGSLALGPGRR